MIYHVTKGAVDTLAWAMARELEEHGVTAVSLHPGFTRTERVLSAFEKDGALGEEWEQQKAQTHSPLYVGRAVAALAADGRVLEKTGRTLLVGKLAREYGFTDVDGRQPQWPPESGER